MARKHASGSEEASAGGLREIRLVRGRLRWLAGAAFAAFVLLLAGLAYVAHLSAAQNGEPQRPPSPVEGNEPRRVGTSTP